MTTAPAKTKTYRPGRIRERNHELILAAAEQEFALHGFRGATIQNIAERAELPKSNVLYYFSNKKKIYAAMFDDILARWNAVFSSVTVDDDPAEALASFIRAKVDMARLYPLASRLFAMEIIQGAPFLMTHLRTNMREWVRGQTGFELGYVEQLYTFGDRGREAPLAALAGAQDARVLSVGYLGLTPEARGRGLGKYLLQTALLTGWEAPGKDSRVERMTVNTCTLDDPRALPLYQKMGFEPIRREEKRRFSVVG